MQRTQTATRPEASKERLRDAWSEEMGLARVARDRGDSAGEWGHLERRRVGDVQTTTLNRTDQPGRTGSARRRV